MDLTDRGIKLLYRQRGSHLRRIDGEIGTVVIEDTAQESPSPELLPELEADEAAAAAADVLNEFPDLDVGIQEAAREDLWEHPQAHPQSPQEPRDPPREEYVHEEQQVLPVGRGDADVHAEQYRFQDIPLRQLSSSITSITSVDVLKETLTNVLENDLIPQAKLHFDQDRDRHSKMVHKLDVRIFQAVSEQLVSDFQDILDINVSNNELCYQLRQLVATREDLNQQLVSTQAELTQLECGGEWQQLQEFQTRLNQRLRLNSQLNELHRVVQSPEPPPAPADPGPHKYTINDLCDSLNPHSGLMARIPH